MIAQWILKASEAFAVKYADVIVADNKGIATYVIDAYNKQSKIIAYGGDHVKRNLSDEYIKETLDKYQLKKMDMP